MKNKLLFITSLFSLFLTTSCNPTTTEYLKRTDWCDNVKNNLNLFIERNKSSDINSNNYVVFDFDNTSSIFDIEEQCIAYQISHMAYNIKPAEMEKILTTGLDMSISLSPYPGKYADWIKVITTSYTNIVSTYGQCTSKGYDDETLKTVRNDNNWKDFSVYISNLYNIIDEIQSHDVSYPWITYMFYGMSHDEIYDLSLRSNNYYKNVVSSKGSAKAITKLEGNEISIDYTSGISVSENIVELMKQLSEHNIKVWICSASNVDIIRGAVDAFGLHDYVTGILAMTNKESSGKMINEYDYSGKGVLTKADVKWEEDSYVVGAQTQGKGKVTAINNCLYARYGKGPVAGFMDSTGDFNFCSEYSSLELVVCFNRADRGITDGGGLIAAIAMYQQDTLKYNLSKALSNGDTLYLLQGREENGYRSFRNSNKTMRLGESEDTLFKDDNNYKLLNYLIEKNESISDSINRFAIKTGADDPNNPLGVKYGFLSAYSGYHSIK